MGFRQIGIVLVCWLLNIADGFDVMAMSYAAPAVVADWPVQPEQLGYVFSAALIGMMLGSLVIAPLADRIGRRRTMLMAAALVTLGMFATSLSQNVMQMAALRFVTGLGIGTVIPTAATVASEFSPARWRNAIVVLVAAGFSFGAVGSGLIADRLIGSFGWSGMFLAGSILTGMLLALSFWLLLESPQHIIASRAGQERKLRTLNDVLNRLGKPAIEHLPVPPEALARNAEAGVTALLQAPLRRKSLRLWGVFISYFWCSYLVANWTPMLFVESGYTQAEGIAALTYFTVGALVGALLLGVASVRLLLPPVVAGMLFATAALVVIWISVPGWSLAVQNALLFAIGFMLSAVYGLYPIVTRTYSAKLRATGMGWATGMGRIGGILSPIVAGYLVAAAWSPQTLMWAVLVPFLLISGALTYLSRD